MSKPENTRRRAGVATNHGTVTAIGAPSERPHHVTHEEQLRAVLAHIRRRDRRLSRAIIKMFSADPRVLGAFGEVLSFVGNEGRRARKARDERRGPAPRRAGNVPR